MAQAASRNITKTIARPSVTPTGRRVRTAHPDTYPDKYAVRVNGDCLAPAIADRTVVLIDKSANYGKGDLVAIYLTPEGVAEFGSAAMLKRVVMPLRNVTLPYRAAPTSNVIPTLVVEQDNPHSRLWIRADWLVAVHRCLGPVPEGVTVVEDEPQRVAAGVTTGAPTSAPHINGHLAAEATRMAKGSRIERLAQEYLALDAAVAAVIEGHSNVPPLVDAMEDRRSEIERELIQAVPLSPSEAAAMLAAARKDIREKLGEAPGDNGDRLIVAATEGALRVLRSLPSAEAAPASSFERDAAAFYSIVSRMTDKQIGAFRQLVEAMLSDGNAHG